MSIAVLPIALNMQMDYAYQEVLHYFGERKLLKSVGADLLFCPFVSPLFYNPTVPMVSVIADLQYIYYPQFFGPQNRYFLLMHFKKICRVATRVVCISDYVRRTVMESSSIDPERVAVIHTPLFDRLAKPPQERIQATLQRLGLQYEGYLLYPANFWAHKNHPMLLTAFGVYLSQHPGSSLRLVCTGAADEQREAVKGAVARMGVEQRVILPGYLPEEEFAALLASCRALIFPSLYEGFGMPVLEAMALGRPVACSSATSLPEVAGNAALYFDPRKPHDIARAIEQIEMNEELIKDLVERGYKRLEFFGGTERMAERYLKVFEDALKASSNQLVNS